MKSVNRTIFRILPTIVLWLLLAAVAGPIAAAENWTRIDSPNFTLAGDADEAELRRVAFRLEKFRAVFIDRFRKFRFASPVPTRVIVFRDAKTFSRFVRIEWAAGYYLAADDVNFIVLSAEGGTKLSTIFHEYTHHLVESALGRSKIPPWLNEGIAEYHETFGDSNATTSTLGAANDSHLALLRKADWIPLDSIISTDYYSLHKQSKESAVQFYAQSWILVHYLIHGGKSLRKTEFDRFIELTTAGSNFDTALRQAFGIAPESLESELKAYVRRKKLGLEEIKTPAANFSEETFRVVPISDAEAVATQAEIFLRSDRLAEARVLANRAVALDPDSSYVNTIAGLVEIHRKNWRDARRHLEFATRSPNAGYYAHYCLGLAVIRENMTDLGFIVSLGVDDAELIRRALGKSLELNPAFAESYNLLAFVSFIRNERVDEGITQIKKALAIAPGNQWFAVRLAELLMRKEQFAEARTIASRVKQTAADDRLRLYAENTVRNIDSLEAQTRDIAEARKRNSEEVTDEPLSEEEIARRRDRALLESTNLALRPLSPGESRIIGRVRDVVCEGGKVWIVATAGNAERRFSVRSLSGLSLVSFDPRFASIGFGCGVFDDENTALLTFRGESSASKIAELIAIEFVPAGFRIID